MTDLELVREHHYELAADRGSPEPLEGFPRRCSCGGFLKREWHLDESGYGRFAEYTYWIECQRCGEIHKREI